MKPKYKAEHDMSAAKERKRYCGCSDRKKRFHLHCGDMKEVGVSIGALKLTGFYKQKWGGGISKSKGSKI